MKIYLTLSLDAGHLDISLFFTDYETTEDIIIDGELVNPLMIENKSQES